MERTLKNSEQSRENEEQWTLTEPTGLKLQIMALGPSSLRGMEDSCDSEGKVEF